MDSTRIPKVANVQIFRPGKGSLSRGNGTLHLTTHHLIYTYQAPVADAAEGETKPEGMWVPYPLISQVARQPPTLQGLCPLAFRLRTFEAFTLYFSKESDGMEVIDTVKGLTVVGSVTHLYAFFYSPEHSISNDGRNGWEIYNVQKEFMRMGVGERTKAWRFTDLNKDYSFAPTYPAKLVVPARIGDATLSYAGKFRSKARIPTLSYLHWSNYGSITRCSQPLVGIKQNRSIQDEKLVEAIFQSHLSVDSPYTVTLPDSRNPKQGERGVIGATCTNVIIDARPTANAMANVAQGGGSENMDHYKSGTGVGFGVTKKAYLGIDNIHVVRDSLSKLVEALRGADGQVEPSLDGTIPTEMSEDPSSTGVVDRQALQRSGWLKHLGSILQGTLIVVRTVHVASSHVLVHCSDGWDRTAQITALSQLCLDPYYRTIRGFIVLIEKEWCSFGHKFLDRCGHLSSERFFVGGSSASERVSEVADEGGGGAGAIIAGFRDRISNPAHIKEMSPVFHQFLECVRNIQRQFPDRFEFNEYFLRKIHWHLYACEFGTFLFNCERERRVSLDGASSSNGIQKTHSVWEWILSEEHTRNGTWLNPTYNKSLDEIKGGAGDMGVLLPAAKSVRFWNELYGKTDEEMNGKVVLTSQPDPELKIVNDLEDDTVLVQGVKKGTDDSVLVDSKFTSPISSRNSTPVLSTSSTPALDPGGSSSLGASLATNIPPTSETYVPSSSAPYSHLYERPPPPPQMAKSATSTDPNQSLVSPFSATSLADGLVGFANNAGGGMKSMWGRFSSNASAAFSAVQDA
ncbi:phosphatases II, partial [Serendipita vermifera]